MMQYIGFFLSVLMTILLVLFFNGNIVFEDKSLPPFGKLLNPYNGIWNNGEKQFDHSDQEILNAGVSESVKIIYDDRNVPHIFAQNTKDALFAQGYVEARDRYFQMDFTSRAAGGELSEYLGKITMERDIYNRKNGMQWAAENAIRGWKKIPDKYAELESYLEGINAYFGTLNEQNKPIEYKLLNVSPPEWTAQKSALVFKYLSDILCGRASDIASSNMLATLGSDQFNELYPERLNQRQTVIPEGTPYSGGTYSDSINLDERVVNEAFYDYYYKKYPPGVGSNNWALSGSKTSSGFPILCNDPHLSLSLPSVWYELSIHTPDFNAYGVTIPGMPGIMIGFNEDIAWGETNVGQDVKDFYQISWTDDTRLTYQIDDSVKEVEIRKEVIKVKGGEDTVVDVKYTDFGPILFTSNDGKHDLAVRWLAHDEQNTAESNTFIDGMQCSNYAEYLSATAQFMTPAQNFAYADKSGTIALRVNGKFPKKSKEQGRFVEKGTESRLMWQDYIPREENPQIINPDRGFISSANQRSAAADYPYYYNGQFEDYRNMTINTMLASGNNWTPEKMMSMQNNSYSRKAEELIPLILNSVQVEKGDKVSESVYSNLQNWNLEYLKSSISPTYFEKIARNIYINSYDEIYALRDTFDVVYPDWWSLTELLKTNINHSIFDLKSTAKIENGKDIIQNAWNELIEDVKKEKDEKSWEWAHFRPLDINHIMLIPSFSAKGLEADGCGDAINATRSNFGPSWRMIVALGPEVEAYGVFPGGQSGNPASQYYKTGLENWLNGKYFKLHFVTNAKALNDVKVYTLTINP